MSLLGHLEPNNDLLYFCQRDLVLVGFFRFISLVNTKRLRGLEIKGCKVSSVYPYNLAGRQAS